MTNTQEEQRTFPKEINAYTIENEIGKSALGGVYSAINEYTEEKVAIKIISKESLQYNKTELTLINNEITILKLLNHKNIIKLYEVFETESNIYIVTELCTGKELFHYIYTKKALNEYEALPIFHQIIDAMVYLHDMNIVHRDIKPENILFDSYGNIKIVDFGYSCYYSNSEKTLNEDLGTPSYACPEMHKGIWYHPEQADVWSCGILLYVMTCGYLPFSEEDEEENGRLIENGEYQIPDTLSPQLQDLIRHMLDPNPTTRYYFKDIITHDWFNSNQALPDLIGGVNYFKMKYPIDMRILNICETYGFDKDQVRAGLENNKYNNCTAVYRLCVKKVVDAGMTSISDLQSEEFKEYKYNKENWIDERESKKTKEDFERKEMERKRLLKIQEDEMAKIEEEALNKLEEINTEYLKYISNKEKSETKEKEIPKTPLKEEIESVSVESKEALSVSPKEIGDFNLPDLKSELLKERIKTRARGHSEKVIPALLQRFRRSSISKIDLKKEDYFKRANPTRRNAIIKRNEIEEAVRLYRQNNIEEVEESDEGSINDIGSIKDEFEDSEEKKKEEQEKFKRELIEKENERLLKEEKERERIIEEQKRKYEEEQKEKVKKEEEEKLRKEEERKEKLKKRIEDERIRIEKEKERIRLAEEEKIKKEQERIKAENEEKERLKKEEEEKERLRKEVEEKERLKREAEERERLKREAEEKERLRLELEEKEKERIKKEIEEKERLKKEAEEREKERLRIEEQERERLKKEAEEKERLRIEEEERERLKREEEEKEKERQRIEEEERKRIKREEEERIKKEAKEKELQDQERLRKEAEENERIRLEKEEKIRKENEEKERIRKELEEKEHIRLEAERIKLEEERKEQERINLENERRIQLEKETERLKEESIRIQKETNRYKEERSHFEKEDQNTILNQEVKNSSNNNEKEIMNPLPEIKKEVKPIPEEHNNKELYIDTEKIKSELNQRPDLEKIRLRKLIEEKERIQKLRKEREMIKREKEERRQKQINEEKKRKEEEYKEKIRKIEEEKERIKKMKEEKERLRREKEERILKENEMKAQMQLEQEKREREELKKKYEELLKRDIQNKTILPIKKVKSSHSSKTDSNNKLNKTKIQDKQIKNLTCKLDEEESKKNILLQTDKNSLNITTEEVEKNNTVNPIFIEYKNNPISHNKKSQSNTSNSLSKSRNNSKSKTNMILNDFDMSSNYLNKTTNHKYNSTENINYYRYIPQTTRKEYVIDNEELSSFLTNREIQNNYKPKKIKDVKAKIRPLRIREESFDSNYEFNFDEYKNKVQSILSGGESVKKYKHVRTSSLPIKKEKETSIKKKMKKASTKSLKYSDDSFFSSTKNRYASIPKTPMKSNNSEAKKLNKSYLIKDNLQSTSKKPKSKINKYSSTASMPSIIDINDDDVIFKKVPITNMKKQSNKKETTYNINSERMIPPKKRNIQQVGNTVNAFDKVSTFKSIKTFQNEEPNHYKGVIDIRCISPYDIKESLNRVLNRLKQKNIFYVQTSLYKLRCSKQLTSFDIELCLIDKELCYYIVKVKSGGVNANVDIISHLFN